MSLREAWGDLPPGTRLVAPTRHGLGRVLIKVVPSMDHHTEGFVVNARDGLLGHYSRLIPRGDVVALLPDGTRRGLIHTTGEDPE